MATTRAESRRWEGNSMCVSRGAFLAASAGALLLAGTASAADGGRLDLLAAEAVDVMGHAASSPSRTGLLVLLAIPFATMVAAFLGTWLGIRGLSFGSLRHKDGWREVAYRFRSEQPLTAGKDVLRRMGGVLDELEDLGRRMRARPASAPAPRSPARPKSATAARSVAPPESPRPVRFVRREEAPVAAPETAPAPAPAAAPGPAPAPARAAAESDDRGDRYRRARALLEEGHDRETVQSLTGLKLAELDLIRCAVVGMGELT